MLVGRPVETPEQHQALARLDGAAILMKMECEVTPLPFFPDTSDLDKLWKKVPVDASTIPAGFPETTTVEHCMHFVLDITSVHPVESKDKFWCQAIDFTDDEYVALPSELLLDAIPDKTLGMKDVVNLSPEPATFVEYQGTEDVRGSGVPPIYSPNVCSRPPIGAGPQWPNNGCICFQPENAGNVSYYDMIDAKDSLPSSSFGYRTAVNTSVTSGVTVAAWVKLGDTSGPPWNYDGINTGEKSGQQTSLIFTRGQLASYGMGYNLGVGKDKGFKFEVVVKGCPFYTNGTTCVNDCNESDTDTTYDGKYECCKTNFPGFSDNPSYGACMATPGGIGSQRLTLESDVNLYCDANNPYCDDYIANWHYIVGTYDAELGRASFYVDNKLIKAKDVNSAFTERYHRDIKWGNDALARVTRVGNG